MKTLLESSRVLSASDLSRSNQDHHFRPHSIYAAKNKLYELSLFIRKNLCLKCHEHAHIIRNISHLSELLLITYRN